MKTYAELLCHSHFSFLRAASSPEELITQAHTHSLDSIAICDYGGVYGLPKAYRTLKNLGSKTKLICGAELVLCKNGYNPLLVVLLAKTKAAYSLICQILTQAHASSPKSQAQLDFDTFTTWTHSADFNQIVFIPRFFDFMPNQNWLQLLSALSPHLLLPLVRFLDGKDQSRYQMITEASKKFSLKIVATNDTHFHAPSRKNLYDFLIATQNGVSLQNLKTLSVSNAQHYLREPELFYNLFSGAESAVKQTLQTASQFDFKLSELKYTYPSEWIPKGHSAQSYLEFLVQKHLPDRYPLLSYPSGPPANVLAQLKHELSLIKTLHFADYFLTLYEIIDFARKNNILYQGRGSAANSVICYILGITAIDPVRMNLLFERFISVERGEPPDIDVDFENARREEVIQHVYTKYGRNRAAMVAAVITYQSRMAKRELIKAFGYNPDQDPEILPRHQKQIQTLSEELIGCPRHLSIHSGGFTLSAEPITHIVPVEPATMPGRTIIQWDKEDLETLGLLKVDLLALGMFSALKLCFDDLKKVKGAPTSLAEIPPEDPKTYQMMQKADTVGVFQIESRAQMSMLPRLKPKTFYDLVIQVAIMRPGPIQGKMVHPYLRRRRGTEPLELPDPRLAPILLRTLGVPLFQEQIMKIAIVLAGFTPGESDTLRRAIGAWKKTGAIESIGQRLMQGLLKNGISKDYAQRLFDQIKGFADYGFPESHAASFALIAYASAYLKCHYPAAFICAVINSQPMGFYSNSILVDDLKRHGVDIKPIDLRVSSWKCTLEPKNGSTQMDLRLGFSLTHGMSQSEYRSLEKARQNASFLSLWDFIQRSGLRQNTLHQLAIGDVFILFGLSQREALWEILKHHARPSLLDAQLELPFDYHPTTIRLSPYSRAKAIQKNYQSFGVSTKGHPMEIIRPKLGATFWSSQVIAKAQKSQMIWTCGLKVIRQKPPTAKGFAFVTLEDEFGMINLVFRPKVYLNYRDLLSENIFLSVQGRLEVDGDCKNIIVKKVTHLTHQ